MVCRVGEGTSTVRSAQLTAKTRLASTVVVVSVACGIGSSYRNYDPYTPNPPNPRNPWNPPKAAVTVGPL